MRWFHPGRRQKLRAMLQHDRLAGQTLLVFGLKILNAGASFGLSLLIARAFGASGSGYFGICVTTVTVMSYVVLSGLDYTVLRIASGDLREGEHAKARGVVVAACRILAVTAPVAAIAIFLSARWLSEMVLQQPAVASLLGIMIIGVVPLAFQRIASTALRAMGKTFTSQLIDGPLGTSFAFLGVVVVLLLPMPVDLNLPGALYVAGMSIGAAVGWTVYARAMRGRPAAARVAWLPLIVAGLPILAVNLSNVFTEWYTTISLGRYWPAEVVGQYRVAWQFVAIAGLVQIAMETIVGPRIAAAARVGAKDEIVAVARKSIMLALLLSAPIFLVLMIFPERLLSIFGPEFRAGVPVLRILAVGQLFRLVSGPLGSIIVMTGAQRWSLTYTGTSVVLCIVLVAWLVPTYGAVGAAVATTATVIVRNLMGGIIVAKVLKIDLFRWRRS